MLTGIRVGFGSPPPFSTGDEVEELAALYIPNIKDITISFGCIPGNFIYQLFDMKKVGEYDHETITRMFLLYMLSMYFYGHSDSKIWLSHLMALKNLDKGAHFRGAWYLGERCTKQLIGQYTIPTNPPPIYIDDVPGDFIERLQAADWIDAIPFAFQGFTESNYTLFWRTVTLGYWIPEFFHVVNTDEVGPVGYTDRFHVPHPPQAGHHPGTYKITPYTRSIGLRDWYIDVAIPSRPRRQRLTIPAVDPSSLVDAGVLVPDDVTPAALSEMYTKQMCLNLGMRNVVYDYTFQREMFIQEREVIYEQAILERNKYESLLLQQQQQEQTFIAEHELRVFIAGFGSSMLFGTIVGSLADKQGRKRACVTSCITYILSCITKHSPQYKILMVGGITTSLMFSAFESWLVAEHNKRGFEQQWLSVTSKWVYLLQIGQGTCSNVYKARDRNTGKIVALELSNNIRFSSCVDFPSSSFRLLTTLLALDPSCRGTASSALHNEFFTASPKACDLSGLPVIYKEEEEPDHTSDRKKQRSSMLKQRSRTHNKKDSATEKSKGDSGSSKEPRNE
ncbi:hypothetical protein GIB67_005036 [Kingdonia uniflora]|uniref:Uncharacterized protein n=1 Tax=Kingdonia uniflora TaxID=39325 RepID=A0A7J7NNC3_9MAGN|nr:hypothetical protein GIB67_005036 [Kingdonia uniflora]